MPTEPIVFEKEMQTRSREPIPSKLYVAKNVPVAPAAVTVADCWSPIPLFVMQTIDVDDVHEVVTH